MSDLRDLAPVRGTQKGFAATGTSGNASSLESGVDPSPADDVPVAGIAGVADPNVYSESNGLLESLTAVLSDIGTRSASMSCSSELRLITYENTRVCSQHALFYQ